VTLAKPVRIEQEQFFDQEGRRIAVVRNAGNDRSLRPIDHFGQGPSRNVLKKEIYTTLSGFNVSHEGLATVQKTSSDPAANWVGWSGGSSLTPRKTLTKAVPDLL
jgi:hypothetical protein